MKRMSKSKRRNLILARELMLGMDFKFFALRVHDPKAQDAERCSSLLEAEVLLVKSSMHPPIPQDSLPDHWQILIAGTRSWWLGAMTSLWKCHSSTGASSFDCGPAEVRRKRQQR